MRLYHHPFSANARRAVMTALHLELPVELVLTDLTKGDHRKPEYLKLNPNGRVPVLDDEGFHLFESAAIMQYLADKSSNQTIYPRDIQARADVNRWLFWNAQHFQVAAGTLNWEHFVKGILGAGPPNPADVERGERLFHDAARVLDAHLAEREWMVGPSLTLADYALGATLMSATTGKFPMNDYKNIHRWFARVQELPAWKKTNPQMPAPQALRQWAIRPTRSASSAASTSDTAA